MNGAILAAKLFLGLPPLTQNLADTSRTETALTPSSDSLRSSELSRQNLTLRLQSDFHLLQLYGLHAARSMDPRARSKNLEQARDYARRLHHRLAEIKWLPPDSIPLRSWHIRVDLALSEVYGGLGDYGNEQARLRAILEQYFSNQAEPSNEDEKRLLQKVHYNLEASFYNQSTKPGLSNGLDETRGDRQAELLCRAYPQEEVCAAALALTVQAKTRDRYSPSSKLEQARDASFKIVKDFPSSPQADWVRKTFFAGKDVPKPGDWNAAFKATVAAAAGRSNASLSDPARDAMEGVAWLPAVLGLLTVTEKFPPATMLSAAGKLLAIGVASGLAGGASKRMVERRQAIRLAYDGFDAIPPSTHRKNVGNLFEVPIYVASFTGIGGALRAGALYFFGARTLASPLAPFAINAATGAGGSLAGDLVMAKIRDEQIHYDGEKAARTALLAISATAASALPYGRIARGLGWDRGGRYIVASSRTVWDPNLRVYVFEMETEATHVLASSLREGSLITAAGLTSLFLPTPSNPAGPAERVGDHLQYGLWTVLLPGRSGGIYRESGRGTPSFPANSPFYPTGLSLKPTGAPALPSIRESTTGERRGALATSPRGGDNVIVGPFNSGLPREAAEAALPRVVNGDLRLGPTSLAVADSGGDAEDHTAYPGVLPKGISSPPELNSNDENEDASKTEVSDHAKTDAPAPSREPRPPSYRRPTPRYPQGDFGSREEARLAIRNQIRKDRSLEGIQGLLSDHGIEGSRWILWANVLGPLDFVIAHGDKVYERSEIEAARGSLTEALRATPKTESRHLPSELQEAAKQAYRQGLEPLEIRRLIREQGWRVPPTSTFTEDKP